MLLFLHLSVRLYYVHFSVIFIRFPLHHCLKKTKMKSYHCLLKKKRKQNQLLRPPTKQTIPPKLNQELTQKGEQRVLELTHK